MYITSNTISIRSYRHYGHITVNTTFAGVSCISTEAAINNAFWSTATSLH